LPLRTEDHSINVSIVPEIIHSNAKVFAVSQIKEEEYLNRCRRTSFTWTELPNTICLAMNREYFHEAIANRNINGIIAPLPVVQEGNFGKTIVIAEKANELFYFLHNQGIHEKYKSNLFEPMIHPTVRIAHTAIVGKNVRIGENVIIHDNVIICDNTIIGPHSVLYENVTVGTQGFFSKMILNRKTHIKHFGGVKIGENCVIHTGTNISRSVNESEYTTLGNNVHIGIHSNIGHDCIIQDDCDISAKVMLAGRVKIGAGSWIGASVSFANMVRVGKGANVKIGSVVIDDVPDGGIVSGNFAVSHSKNLKEFLKRKST
jgi:acyl-[acyl carrier protein]--UDP-N-acetylglucosamine O-acyltransferase